MSHVSVLATQNTLCVPHDLHHNAAWPVSGRDSEFQISLESVVHDIRDCHDIRMQHRDPLGYAVSTSSFSVSLRPRSPRDHDWWVEPIHMFRILEHCEFLEHVLPVQLMRGEADDNETALRPIAIPKQLFGYAQPLDITNTVTELPARSIRNFPSSPMPPL